MFEQQERKADKEVPTFFPPDYNVERNEGKYEPFDYYVSKPGQPKIEMEYKERLGYNSDTFNTWFLEDHKVQEIGTPFLYLNKFKDGKVLVWFVTDELLENTDTDTRRLPKTTGASRGTKMKKVWNLPTTEATRLR